MLNTSRLVSYLTMGLFFISLLSGFIVAFAYHPSLAFQSVQKINFLIPYGLFFRKLHYFSSEAFTLFLLLHVVYELSKQRVKISSSSWNYSILALVLVIILMFSGFVLKADASGKAAAEVTFNLLKETPILSNFLALLKDSSIFYYKFFIWHILFLPIILLYAIYKHTNTLQTRIEFISTALGVTILTLLIFSMPKDIVLGVDVKHLSSPWFFLGAENLLAKSWSPLSVNLFLATPFLFLILYFYTKHKNIIKVLLALWLIVYILISILLK